MSGKRKQLEDAATRSARQPDPERHVDQKDRKQGYRVVPVSLYTPEAEWLDYVSAMLKQAGNPKANRSLVVREAIHRLQRELNEKTPAEVLLYFVEQHAQRHGGRGD